MISDAFCSVIVRQHHPDLLGVDGAPDRPPPLPKGKGMYIMYMGLEGGQISVSRKFP